MLDRKTKDIDASMELLMDRYEQCKLFFLLFYIVGASIFIGSFINYLYTGLVGYSVIVALLGIWTLTGSLFIIQYRQSLSIIILLKRDKEVKKP